GNDGTASVVDDEALAHEPAYGDAVLEERVHPWIGMRVVGRGGAVHGIAAGVRGHGHYAHAIGEASVDGLEALVIEGFSEQHSDDGFNKLRVGDGAVRLFVRGDAGPGVFSLFAAKGENEVRDGLAE